MNKSDLINLKLLKEIENDKQGHIRRLNERIHELIRMRDILLDDIEKITNDIEKLESGKNE